jgi:hypothetical protein
MSEYNNTKLLGEKQGKNEVCESVESAGIGYNIKSKDE